jgi:hypothetical protein
LKRKFTSAGKRAEIVRLYRDERCFSQKDIAELSQSNIATVNMVLREDMSENEFEHCKTRNLKIRHESYSRTMPKRPRFTFDETFSRVFCAKWTA